MIKRIICLGLYFICKHKTNCGKWQVRLGPSPNLSQVIMDMIQEIISSLGDRSNSLDFHTFRHVSG